MHTDCPVVLHGLSMPDLIQHLIGIHSAPTTLIVCSSRSAFEHQLLSSLSGPPPHVDQVDANAVDVGQVSKHPLVIPTLHLLSCTSTIRLAFCPSLEALRAHLTVLSADHVTEPSSTKRGDTRRPILCILNFLAIHRETTSFSAQGLSRTLAIAVDAAARCGQKLVLSECPVPPETGRTEEGSHEAAMEATGPNDGQDSADTRDPWEEQLSILSVTTKSFGVGSRGWAGRTVSARAVAERWCRFERYQGVQARQVF
ncbi:uncharacterized protein BKA78DRAFT_315141 [Phyllosticta capitalensis]|uniref:uncharacterized protein n=1 Tax=Phyllosticta capitalensis TaxID=121624 RepID=UPI00312E3B46